MIIGGQFRCFNCNCLLVNKIEGSNYILELICKRCHAEITIKMQEPMSKEAIKYFKEKEDAK